MVNKKGWIRTLEAVIAILLILGFILYITPKSTVYAEKTPQVVESAQNFILKSILENDNYRSCVLSGGAGGFCGDVLCTSYRDEIKTFIKSNEPIGYTSACEVCPSSSSCVNLDAVGEKSVFTSAIFVSEPGKGKVMRIYFWEQ